MMKVGLTGSIGMGKSTVAAMFAEKGIPVFDADAVVHSLQGPGGALLAPIEEAFPGTTTAHGVDRNALGRSVFGDARKLRQLEAIVHPAVEAERWAFIARHPDTPILLFDIPLLFEKGRETSLAAVVLVSAPKDVQRRRVLARPGMTIDKFERIKALQMPDAAKRARADFVIETGVTLAETRTRVGEVLACLLASEQR